MVKKRSNNETPAIAFISNAVAFLRAADALCDHRATAPADPVTTGPIYFLYAHALELAFKGYLRASGTPTKELATKQFGHRLGELLGRSSAMMNSLPGIQQDVLNVVEMFDRSNRGMGLRYFTIASQTFPELSWAGEVVRSVVDAAKNEVKAIEPLAFRPGPAVKVDFIIGRPRDQK